MPKVKKSSVAFIGWEEGGPGQVHSWFEQETGHNVYCFVNPTDEPIKVDLTKQRDSKKFSYPTKDSFKDRLLITSSKWAEKLSDLGIKKVLIYLSDNEMRQKCFKIAVNKGFEIISAIHPSVIALPEAHIGTGVIIHAGVIIGYKAEIHDGAIINTGAQVDHHSIVKEFATLDPGVVLAGNVTIHRKAQIHTRAVIINKIRVGENSIVGAGAVIIKDVPSFSTVVGVPGRVIKSKEGS
jgi:sugar O-acyltransferase (sialic acid O-acetyltransferase NeuD family)